MADLGKAAFFDVDGTLVRTNIVHAFAYYAMNQGTILGTAWQTAKTLASIPLFMATDRFDRKAFNELFYRYYEGQSEDRLETLAGELFEDVLEPAIHPGSARLVAGARRAGCRIVFVTGALDFTVRDDGVVRPERPLGVGGFQIFHISLGLALHLFERAAGADAWVARCAGLFR